MCDRSDSPWDDSSRRSSQVDCCPSLRRQVLKEAFFEISRCDRNKLPNALKTIVKHRCTLKIIVFSDLAHFLEGGRSTSPQQPAQIACFG